LEQGVPFDDDVWAGVDGAANTPDLRRVAFTGEQFWASLDSTEHSSVPDDVLAGAPEVRGLGDLHVLFLDWKFRDLFDRVETAIGALAQGFAEHADAWVWMERVNTTKKQGDQPWRVSTAVHSSLERLSSLATDLLPDFMDGSINAFANDPGEWGEFKKVGVYYGTRNDLGVPIDMVGRGAARWIAAAVQMALDLMTKYPDLMLPTGARIGRLLRTATFGGRARSPSSPVRGGQRRALVPAHGRQRIYGHRRFTP
jgi:hypothetical protein